MHRPRFFREAGAVPGVEDPRGDSWEIGMTDRKARAEFKRVTNHAKSSIQQTNRSGFACIQILAGPFPQPDVSTEISFVEGHEMRMNIPAVRIALVHGTKDCAGQ